MVDAHQDLRRIFLLSITLGLTTLAFIIAKTGRDALFFHGSGGLLQLPLLYIYIAGASLPLAMIFVKAMKTWGARPARVGILSIAAAVMAAAAPFFTTRRQYTALDHVYVHPRDFRARVRKPLASGFGYF